MFELKYGMYRACLIALKIDAKFEGNLLVLSKMT